jgi:hypothetical protein
MSPAEIEELYRLHARRMAGYLMRVTRDAEVAVDLTAETFAAALVSRGRYRAELGSPSTWGAEARELLVWGRVPDRAEKVVITARGRTRYEVVPTDGPKTFPGRFYVIPVRPGLHMPRINWLDAAGRPGSRGIRLLPPVWGR